MRVLVVDDAGFMREIFIQGCQELGVDVVAEATNGNEAISLARLHKPDVVIMDLVLPEKNGVETAIEILKENPRMQIIATSSLTEKWIEKKARDAGCNYFLKKPFTKIDMKNVFDLLETERRHLKHG